MSGTSTRPSAPASCCPPDLDDLTPYDVHLRPMVIGFKRGAPAFKFWITKTMQKAMKRHRPDVNWSQVLREAIDEKLRELGR